jgi:hypothetical protein
MADHPKRYNVPAYASVPEHGSWGVGPRISPGTSVRATALANQGGGYPTITQVERGELTDKQHANVIRLVVAIFGYGNHEILNLLLGEALKTKCNKNTYHQ